MIIPDDALPSWTNVDASNANLYALHRARLWVCNYSVSLWPQIFSWLVVNIYPASSEHDYHFEDAFADKAILVTIEWDKTGKGCQNSTCYATYPRAKICTTKDSPIIFPSGNKTEVTACQPACFAKQRGALLRKTVRPDVSLIDQNDPTSRCVPCQYLDGNSAYETRRWIFGKSNSIDVFDSRAPEKPVRNVNLATATDATTNKDGAPVISVDTLDLVYDPKYNNCILVSDQILRSVVEPRWRDPGNKCKLTNFEIGDDLVWGYRYKEKDPDFQPNYNFLVKHSTAYCRAFIKELNENGECVEPWWEQALTYTIAGDGIIHWVHSLIHYDPLCVKPIRSDESDRPQARVRFDSSTNFEKWWLDIDKTFVLPPPNVQLSDLGINVRLTGNRLYWNNREGIVSQYAMFHSVETLVDSITSLDDEEAMKRLAEDALAETTSSSSPSTPTETKKPHPSQSDLCKFTKSKHLYKSYNAIEFDTKRNEKQKKRVGGPIKREDDEALQDLMKRYRDLMKQKSDALKKRFSERRDSEERSDKSILRDPEIDERVREIWTEVKNKLDALIENATTENDSSPTWDVSTYRRNGSSVDYSLETNEYAAQYFVESRNSDDKKRISSNANRSKRETTSDGDQRADAGGSEIDDLLNHILNEQEAGMGTLGALAVMAAQIIGEQLFKKTLKFAFRKIVQMISRRTAGAVSLSLLKVGLRIGISNMVGELTARLTTRLMIMIGQAATVVGIIIDIISFISFAFDVALMFGWDPGHFNNERDLKIYYDMALYFAEAMNENARGPVKAMELMNLLMSPSKDADKGASGKKTDETASNDPADNTNAFASSLTAKTIHVDERLRSPKWFNKKFDKCFQPVKDGDYRLAIQDSLDLWNIVTSFDYLGSLTYNSFGQRIVDNPTKINLTDDDITNIITETEYRDLMTVSSKANVDNRNYHDRIDTTSKATSYGLIAGIGVAGVSTATLIIGHLYPRVGNVLSPTFVNVFLVVTLILSLIYVAASFIPVSINQNETGKKSNPFENPSGTSNSADSSSFYNETNDPTKLVYYVTLLRTLLGTQGTNRNVSDATKNTATAN